MLCKPDSVHETVAVDAGPRVASVQFISRSDGDHSMVMSSRSDKVSSALIRRRATWSSSKFQTPLSSVERFEPPYHNSGKARVGATFKTLSEDWTVVVSPSSSVATAVTIIGPSAIGVNVHVGWVNPSSQAIPGHEILTC